MKSILGIIFKAGQKHRNENKRLEGMHHYRKTDKRVYSRNDPYADLLGSDYVDLLAEWGF